MHQRAALLGLLSLTSTTIVTAQALAPWEILQVDTYSPSGRPGSSTTSYIKTTITDPNSLTGTNTIATCTIEWDSLTKDETPYNTALECTPVEDGTWEFEVLQAPADPSSSEEPPSISISNFILRFTRFTKDGNLYIGSVSLEAGPDTNSDLSFMCAASGFCHANLRPESTPLRVAQKEIGFKLDELKVRQTDDTQEEAEPEPEPEQEEEQEQEQEPPIPWQISRVETRRPSSVSATRSSGMSSISLTITEPGTGFEGMDMTSSCNLEWDEAAGESPYEKVQTCSEVEEGYFMFEVVKAEASAGSNDTAAAEGQGQGDAVDLMSSFNIKFTRLGADGKTYLGVAEFETEKNLASNCSGGGNGVCEAVLKEEFIPLVVVPGVVKGR